MTEVIPLKVVDGADPGEKKLGAGDVVPLAHLPDSLATDADLNAHISAVNPHNLTLAALGGISQMALDAHANNANLHSQIDDAAETALNLWSAIKIKNAIQAQIDALVGSAPGALDTLNELAAALGNDPNAITTLTNELASKIPQVDRGADNGVCELINGLVPVNRLVFGTWFQDAHDMGVSKTTSENWVDKLEFTTPAALPLGAYRSAVAYGWNHNDVNSDFEGRVIQGATQLGQQHFQKPQDSSGNWNNTGTDQRQYTYRVFYLEDVPGTIPSNCNTAARTMRNSRPFGTRPWNSGGSDDSRNSIESTRRYLSEKAGG